MYQSDYILRMIEQLGIMLKRMLDAVREARPEDALELSDEALESVLELDADLVRAMDGTGLVTYLSAGGQADARQMALVGETLAVRAEALRAVGDEVAAKHEAARARIVLEYVVADAEGESVLAAREAIARLDALF